MGFLFFGVGYWPAATPSSALRCGLGFLAAVSLPCQFSHRTCLPPSGRQSQTARENPPKRHRLDAAKVSQRTPTRVSKISLRRACACLAVILGAILGQGLNTRKHRQAQACSLHVESSAGLASVGGRLLTAMALGDAAIWSSLRFCGARCASRPLLERTPRPGFG